MNAHASLCKGDMLTGLPTKAAYLIVSCSCISSKADQQLDCLRVILVSSKVQWCTPLHVTLLVTILAVCELFTLHR